MSPVLTAPAPRNELVVLLDDSGLDASKTRILGSRFADYFTIAEQWKTEAQQLVVTSEDQQEQMLRARQGRLVLKDKRVQIERTRKELKEDSLKEGRAIDAVAKLLTALIEPTEQFLLEQEEFSKRLQDERDRKRESLIAIRRDILSNCDGQASDEQLAEWTAGEFSTHVAICRKKFEAVLAAQQAEAERQRKADQRNRDELLLENQRLQNEQRQQQKDNETLLQALELQQQQLRAEAQGLRDAETKRQQAEKTQQQQERLRVAALAAGPDKLKLVALADRIHQLTLGLTCELVQGEKARTVVASVDSTLDKIQHWLREQADIL